jgi:hypothetical protein
MDTLNELIMNSFSFGEMGDQEKEKMVNELADIAISRCVMRAVDKMSEEQANEFNAICGDNAEMKKVFSYLETAVPSFYDMLREEVARLQTVAEEK